jgi:hypothetical protein
LRKNNRGNNSEIALKNIIEKVNENIYTENEKIGRFRENIYKLLDETTGQITKN